MRREGLPIEGLYIVAGIPTTGKAVEIIEGHTEAASSTLLLSLVLWTAPREYRPRRISVSSPDGRYVSVALDTRVSHPD
jgi:hypothetical protein